MITDKESGGYGIYTDTNSCEVNGKPFGEVTYGSFCSAISGNFCEWTESVHTRNIYDGATGFYHTFCEGLCCHKYCCEIQVEYFSNGVAFKREEASDIKIIDIAVFVIFFIGRAGRVVATCTVD